MTKTLIKIDVTDWAVEHDQIEPSVTGEDDLIALVTKQGRSTAQVARLAIIARERGLAPTNILPENKPLLNAGAAVDISSKIARRMKEAQLPNGNTLTVREFVAPVREEEEEGQLANDTQNVLAPSSPLPETFVSVESPEARGRALDYLYKIVPGYIMGRLKIIAISGGDVKAAADELKNKIDEMVDRLG